MDCSPLNIKIRTGTSGYVYFSCSWRSGFGETSAWHVVKALDEENFHVVGDLDIPGLQWDDDRIRRIMSVCSGFVCVLPFRPQEQTTTSKYIIRELKIAAELGIPITIFYESEVKFELKEVSESPVLVFPENLSIALRSKIYKPCECVHNRMQMDQLVGLHLQGLLEFCRMEMIKPQPYAFLVTRLENDFAQARNSIESTINNEVGIPCLWANDGKHSLPKMGVQESIRCLIKHSEFVIADISFSDNNPNYVSPNIAHEIGIAVAFEKPILLTAFGKPRSPYFSARDLQVVFWQDEIELGEKVRDWLQNNIGSFGRQVYNFSVREKIQNYQPNISPKSFSFDTNLKYSPNI